MPISEGSWIFAAQEAIEAAMNANAARLTVLEFLGLWLAHVRERVRATTYEGYECLLRCHLPAELGALQLADLQPLALNACTPTSWSLIPAVGGCQPGPSSTCTSS